MSTRREQILAAAAAALTGITGVPDTSVYRSRVVPLQRKEFPAVAIEPLQDQASPITVPRLSWELTFHAMIFVRSDTPDQDADVIVKDVHNKLMSNATLDGLVSQIIPVTTSWQFLEADQTALVVMVQFVCSYQTSTNDLTSL